ncbi:hypothetical protein CPC08DRAFT_754221 [Agrocybe pediades]|nr:hypothetical protein CPC08DRAFT_754221 [Agrocybe pediades]
MNPAKPSSKSQGRTAAATRAAEPPTQPQHEDVDVQAMYQHLHSLGIPHEITPEAFKRLVSDDKTRDTLRVIVNRIVGRQEVWKVRDTISRARHAESVKPASKIKAPSSTTNLLQDSVQVASGQRENAYRGLVDGVKKEFNLVKKEMVDLDRQKKDLEKELDYKRRVELLLGTLEKREAIRMDRLGNENGVGMLLRDMQERLLVVTEEFEYTRLSCLSSKDNNDSTSVAISQRRKETATKYRHTAEVLANLHASHIRQAQSSSSREDMEQRLCDVLKRLGLGNDEKALKLVTQQLTEVAKRRAEAKIRALYLNNREQAGQIDLDEMFRSIEQKKVVVQQNVNRAAALDWLCQENIDLLATFRQETIPALSRQLESERKRTEGYMDTLRTFIVESQAKALAHAQEKSFSDEVRDVLGAGRTEVVQDLKELVGRVARSENLQKVGSSFDMNTAEEEEGTNMELMPRLRSSEERIRKLLERKEKKADYGFELAKEIETLLADCKKLK